MAGREGHHAKYRSLRHLRADQSLPRRSPMTVQQLWNRVLAIGLAALPLCAALWIAASWIYQTHAMLSAETMQTRQKLSEYVAMLKRRPEIGDAVMRAGHSGRNYYWSGSTEEGTIDELQQQLRTVIDAAGGRVKDIQTLPATRNDAYSAVNLRVTLDASATELLETLYSLESNRPYLFLDQLHIRAPEQRGNRAQGRDAVLQVSLDLRGYLEPKAVHQ